MKRNLIVSCLAGPFALALSTAVAVAAPGNLYGQQQLETSASSPLVLVRGGGGGHGGFGGGHGGGFGGGFGGHGFGGHGFGGHGGHFHGGFFGAPYVGGNYDDSGCWWNTRYHHWVCY